ncbi:hypothetical protein SAMN05421690_1001183 [Nitrosomonas sp. Nm51]|uniref:DUF5995 family protein n=1 Tax=Nitrosomonas sp. Nm51 TaxID=133720 RepID=UPI0008D26777|nr:DUF5995 family protein [Nitrosomonas sp. Nm51]SEQ79595.1 hypothetical protein SAMN05421690_1001183 [Nitrosomonas sp. Nm51]
MMSDQDFPASIATPAQSIDEVINQLTAIVVWSGQNNSRTGYFAALYRKVTIQVKKGIEAGFFDDGQRMGRFDVIFANRYIHACYQYHTGQAPTQSWVRAFDATERWWPIVLQHLLMGMNAHINLDLGIAATETVPPEELQSLRGDFDKINQVLAGLVGSVRKELAEIWPVFGIMNRFLGNVETGIINFSMEKARDAAWSFAEQLSPQSSVQRQAMIQEKDAIFAAFSDVIMHPGFTLSTALRIIRLGEQGTIRERIEILE